MRKMSPGARMTLLAALFALLTCVLIFGLIRIVEMRVTSGKEMVQVVVARQEIQQGAVIRQDMLQYSSVAASSLPANALREKDAVVGKVVAENLAIGDMVFTQMLKDAGALGLAYTLEEGQRAITIKVDNVTGVDGMIQPGNRVDILIFLSDVQGGHTGVESTVMQDVRVIAINDQIVGTDAPASQKDQSADAGNVFVTLSVTPTQAQMIGLMQDTASYRLTLRPQDEDSLFTGKGTTINDLLWIVKGTAPGVLPQ